MDEVQWSSLPVTFPIRPSEDGSRTSGSTASGSTLIRRVSGSATTSCGPSAVHFPTSRPWSQRLMLTSTSTRWPTCPPKASTAGTRATTCSPRRTPHPQGLLYSVNISNLMMAGKHMSATHVASSNTKFMGNGGHNGIATAAAAHLCRKYSTTPRGIYESHMSGLQAIAAGIARENRYARRREAHM